VQLLEQSNHDTDISNIFLYTHHYHIFIT